MLVEFISKVIKKLKFLVCLKYILYQYSVSKNVSNLLNIFLLLISPSRRHNPIKTFNILKEHCTKYEEIHKYEFGSGIRNTYFKNREKLLEKRILI